ncbi:hypothetical protein [Phormidesmis sp. 146-33]
MIRVSKLSAIAKHSSVGLASLALASLFPAAGLTQSTTAGFPLLIAQSSRDQPVTNPGISGGNTPASTIPSTSAPSVPTGDQPVSNPGVSGGNAPASTIPSTSAPSVPTGDQPVSNPGVSGGNAPASTIPSTSSPSVPTGDQPVSNPGVSGGNAPASTIPSTTPATGSPTDDPANPPNVIERRIIQGDDVIIPNNQTPRQPIRTAPAQTPSQSTTPAPVSPTSQPLPQTTGFIRTAIASQLNNSTPGLDAQLLQATCNQNWRGAIAIVDRALAAAPASQGLYRSQLRQYRGRLESLAAAGTAIPNWTQRCTGS